MQRRKRQADGSLGPLEPIGDTVPLEEQVVALGALFAQEKLNGMKKDAIITGLGAQLVQVRLDVMQLKGGAK